MLPRGSDFNHEACATPGACQAVSIHSNGAPTKSIRHMDKTLVMIFGNRFNDAKSSSRGRPAMATLALGTFGGNWL